MNGLVFSAVVACWPAVAAWAAFSIDPPGPGSSALASFGSMLVVIAIKRRRHLVVVAA